MTDAVVVAFGGNAILRSGERGTLEEQRRNVRRMAEQLGRLVQQGHRVVVTHGNGPQVGDILLASELASETVPPVSLDVAGAMSQGQIGYLLQQEIGSYLSRHGCGLDVCALVTQVLVDAADLAFCAPTKPIGRFYGKSEAARMGRERGWTMVEDAGRGFRRVVPSPEPQSIVEWKAIRSLIDDGHLVIAAGGGGVPVVRGPDGGLRGVDAVIDKDLSAERLASLVGATTLALLTDVPAVAIDFGTPRQRQLGAVSAEELSQYLSDGQFSEGSMGPKVRAALHFVGDGGSRAIITSPSHLLAAFGNKPVGTRVYRSVPVTSRPRRRLAEPA